MPEPLRSLSRRRTLNPKARIVPNKSIPSKAEGAGGSTILLVDDDSAVLEGLRRVFRAEGWDIIAAASGEEALEYLQTHQPDLMITDLSMADVSGWDLLFHEELQRPGLPIFVITALPLTNVGGADLFAAEFFHKPLDLDVLIGTIRRYIGTPRGTG
jgi:DNA-binding response OmpR family regulator